MCAWTLKYKLPDFIVAGILKSGTTSLYVNLSKHPCIEMSPNAFKQVLARRMNNSKEIHFFNDRWSNGVGWYRSLFNNNDKLQGEAASKYLFKGKYIRRMASVVPQAKIIILLRNPVTRAYSQYNFFNYFFDKHLSSADGRLDRFKVKHQRIGGSRNVSFDKLVKGEIGKGVRAGHGIVGKGLYIDMIDDLLGCYPRRQVLIIISEHMKKNMAETYNKIFDFLEVQRTNIDFEMNTLAMRYEKPMSPGVKELLNKFYSSYNDRLFSFLGCKVPEWSSS